METRSLAWQRRYRSKLIATDICVVVFSVFLAQVLRYGVREEDLDVAVIGDSSFAIRYTVVSAALILGWLLALAAVASRDRTIVGVGVDEYKRVIVATLATFGTLAVLAYLLRSQVGRGYVLVALPLGFLLLLLGRWLWRKRLHYQRRFQRNMHRTIVVGEQSKCLHVAKEISRSHFAGFGLLGAITHATEDKELLPGLPVLGHYDELVEMVDRHNVDTLIMTSADSISPHRLRRIGWELESRGVELIVAAALTDIAGPRIHTRPVAGLPLIHVDYPTFSGGKHFAKRASDIMSSSFLIIVLSPLLLAIWAMIRIDSPGSAIFNQERVGIGGKPFRMHKFRSMVTDAEQQLTGLLDQSNGNGVLFKLKDDPRVTQIGKFIRKYSIDELPQLFNVLKGQMSLVGPRPPLPREVERYETWVSRRLLVKPGITGLWQVSGRSDLSWDDSVRLDLYYVENWSLTGDLIILWRTVKTVISPEGAY
ncbi:sugar transferase [Leucobacter denitrificans]|uniref:Sugar transferase n=1 Tax=Leucobacter denitrificans TaxID=683042 RepID=A0A7G9S7A9_9MICO|nr:sugar transferase [Leucobacter denitrificans]QNN63734.1 sugar transferase [Leucobacter denitrificans]